MNKYPYLRSRKRRGRWNHTYKRGSVERSLGVHGLHPSDPRVISAWAAEHARWQERPPETKTPKSGTFAWAVDLVLVTPQWRDLAESTKQNRLAIYRRYIAGQGDRPFSSITTDDLEAALYAKGGHAAINELKALKPVFKHAHKLRFITKTQHLELIWKNRNQKVFLLRMPKTLRVSRRLGQWVRASGSFLIWHSMQVRLAPTWLF